MSSDPYDPKLAIGLAAAVIGAWWMWNQYRRALSKSALNQQMSQFLLSDSARYTLGPQQITIGPAGLAVKGRHHDITQRWSGISEVRETPDALCFIRRDRYSYIIPKRIFRGPAEAQALADQARAWLDEAGQG